MNTDLVIPLGTGGSNNHIELRYSLRSIQTNFLSIRDVYIVGFKPDWIQNIIHVPHPDIHLHNKDANIINKVLFTCGIASLSDDFVRQSDDQFWLQPVTRENLSQFRYVDITQSKITNGHSKWAKRLYNTAEVLKKEGLPTFNYDTHCPVLVNKYEFIRVFGLEHPEFRDLPGYTINSMYFNHVLDGCRLEDETDHITVKGSRKFPMPYLKSRLDKKKFMCIYEAGLPAVIDYLKLKFPIKSKYEK